MVTDARSAQSRRRAAASPQVDVVVVGAGYSGPLMARELARAGKRVVVLEAGPAWSPRDFVSSQIWARRLRSANEGCRSGGTDPINMGFNIGRGLGGSGIHHFGSWFRMHPDEFQTRTRFGRQLDWPIGYEDLRPYYDRVQADVGMSGDARAEVWRPRGEPYPLPPLRLHRHGEVLRRGFDALRLRTSPSPSVVLSRPFKGRPACTYDGWCDAGCAIGALGNPLVTFVPDARRAGVTFQTGARVTKVLTKGRRATGVEYVDASGRTQVLQAKLVVLAAFALETPRILFNSADGGLANSSGLLGRYMHVHMLLSVYGLFGQRTDPSVGTVGPQLLCQDMKDADPAKGHFGGYQWLVATGKKPNDLNGIAMTRPDVHGPALDAFLRTAVQHLGAMDAIGHGPVSADNHLAPTGERDRFGVPIVQLTHAYDADSLKLYDAAKTQGMAIMRAAGARETWASNRNVAHVMGGTIMGRDPRTSVTDAHGRTHDVGNLVVAGPGVFPSGGSVNPTFTQVAWTLRSAEHIARNWKAIV